MSLKTNYDIIGDIHGHADELKALLVKLGYQLNNNGIYSHPDKKVIFLGDFIDRGTQNKEVLEIAKGMVDNGSALAIMGNHEYNAICFNKEVNSEYLREHNEKNVKQHKQPIKEFNLIEKPESDPKEYKYTANPEWDKYIAWFMTLPLFLEIDGFRLVHACWSQPDIDYLKNVLPDGKMTEEFLIASTLKNSPQFNAVEHLLKGKEITLPASSSFNDKDGNTRYEIRTKWWDLPHGKNFRQYAVGGDKVIPENIIPENLVNELALSCYNAESPIVFFGHY